MTSETPGSGTPGWGQPPQPAQPAQPAAEPAAAWPAELVPPDDATQPLPAPAAPVEPVDPAPAWGQPATPAPSTPGTPATPTTPAAPSTVPAQPTTWGQPAPAAGPAVPATAQPAAQQPASPAPGQQPAWGAPPQQPQPQPQQPAYGAPVPPAAAPGGQWGAPPQQPGQPGSWAPPPGAPGAPGGPPTGWAPAPAKSGNGCLKACLIVGIIGVVLAVIAVIALTMLSMRVASDLGVNGDGTLKGCDYISQGDLEAVLGTDATVLPMGGIADATLGQALDKRLLPDTASCWAVGGQGMGVQGRLAAKDSTNASSDFASARQTAQDGAFLGADMPGLGDEAFCTTIGETGGSGVFVRAGDRLVYVSLMDPLALAQGQDGSACNTAAQLALKMLR